VQTTGGGAAAKAARQSSLSWALAAIGVAFVPAAGLAWLAAGRLLRRVHHLTGVVDGVAAGDEPSEVDSAHAHAGAHDLDRTDELDALADGVDRMLARLDAAKQEQQRRLHEVVHELRTPLAVATTNLELARTAPGLDDDAATRLDAGLRALERMGRTVDDLANHGRLALHTSSESRFDLAVEVAALGTEHEGPAGQRGVRLVASGPEHLDVPGDRSALRTAVGNLLANAVRLAPAGSTLTLAWGCWRDWVWVGVRDEGPGLAPADHARAFERSWRGRYDADRDRRGPPPVAGEQPRGLGLTIARQVVEAQGGRLTLASAEGSGSTFVVWLPARPEAEGAEIVAADGVHPLVDPFDLAVAAPRPERAAEAARS
jgi:signal transduction histidine kinase